MGRTENESTTKNNASIYFFNEGDIGYGESCWTNEQEKCLL